MSSDCLLPNISAIQINEVKSEDEATQNISEDSGNCDHLANTPVQSSNNDSLPNKPVTPGNMLLYKLIADEPRQEKDG